MKVKKFMRLSIVLVLTAAMVLMAACSAKEPGSGDKADKKTEEKSEKNGKTKVGFIVQDLTINYFLNVVKGIEDFQDKYDMDVQVIDGHSDATTQVAAVENLITQKVDCIVICPVDVVAPEAVMKEAQEAGIPVITWSEKIEGADAWIAVNNYDYGFENGKIAGQWILDNLDKQEDAKVMYVYVQENEQLIERGEGMMAGLASLAPNAETVAVQSGNTTESGMEAVETTLSKHPDLNVIVCSNDSVALGAYEAMAAAGKGESKVCITGQDADEKNLEYISQDTMLKGTVDIGAYNQGELLCQSVERVLKEGKVKDPIYVSFTPVTKENVEEIMGK